MEVPVSQPKKQISELDALLSEARVFSDSFERAARYQYSLLLVFLLACIGIAVRYETQPDPDSVSAAIEIGLVVVGIAIAVLLLRRVRRRYITRLDDFDRRLVALASDDEECGGRP